MRAFLGLLIGAFACQAQPETQVLTVYKQMEKAQQVGDANAWVDLWSRESAADAEKMRPYLRPRPEIQYTSSKVFVQGDEAALLGRFGKDQFVSMRFVKENGQWKIKDQAFNNTAYPAESIYALIPPPTGAFERAGLPWQNVAAAFDQAGLARHGWQVRATYDESCLYIRIESSTPLPAPGSWAEKPPSGWPVMKIGVPGAGELVLHASANIGDQATFDETGHANRHRPYVAYWRADKMIFQPWAGLQPSPLVQAQGNFLDVRIPLRTMGIADAPPANITIGDAQWPRSIIFSLQVQPYR